MANIPKITIHIDHIKPVSKGGEDDIMNLVTSCESCNLGKGARELSDETTLVKKKAQLDKIQEQREILEMMVEWQTELINLEEEAAKKMIEYWELCFNPYKLNESGLAYFKKFLRKYDAVEIIESIKISADQYIMYEADDSGYVWITTESVQRGLEKLAGILANRRRYKSNPLLKEIHRLLGVIKGNYGYLNIKCYYAMMDKALGLGITVGEIEDTIGDNTCWTDFKNDLEYRISEVENG